jgi:hypothetical protein
MAHVLVYTNFFAAASAYLHAGSLNKSLLRANHYTHIHIYTTT